MMLTIYCLFTGTSACAGLTAALKTAFVSRTEHGSNETLFFALADNYHIPPYITELQSFSILSYKDGSSKVDGIIL